MVKLISNDEKIKLVVENFTSKENIKSIEEYAIFDRFYTADKSRGRTSGLGLSIVKLLVERMGGNTFINIENNKFIITVELKKYKEIW